MGIVYYSIKNGSLRTRMTGMVRTGMDGRFIQYFAIYMQINTIE
jgi:hypothetical protein